MKAYDEYRLSRELRTRCLRLTPHGFRFAGHDGMELGIFEPDETRIIQERSAGNVYVDIGANFGYFVAIARMAGAHVIAFEPLQHNLEVMYGNLLANGWTDIEVFPVGLGSRPGLALLYGLGTGASLLPKWAGTAEELHRTIAVSTLDLILQDRFVGQHLLIKIDVEGAEYSILEGSERTLDRDPAPVWLVEICFRENQPDNRVNPEFRQVFEIFWRRGYRATTVESDAREVAPADVDRWLAAGRRDFGYVNYLFEKGAL